MTCTVIAGAQFNAHPSKISKVPTLRWALPCVSFVAVPTLHIFFHSWRLQLIINQAEEMPLSIRLTFLLLPVANVLRAQSAESDGK